MPLRPSRPFASAAPTINTPLTYAGHAGIRFVTLARLVDTSLYFGTQDQEFLKSFKHELKRPTSPLDFNHGIFITNYALWRPY